MDPALHELIAAGAPGDETAVIVRLAGCDRLPPGLRLVARFGDIATGRALRGELARIHDDPCIASLKAPRVYSGEFEGEPDAIELGEEPGIVESEPDPKDTDRRRPEDLMETGKGAIVAVIDWGCDFGHRDFRTRDGRTRLLALWDQRAPATPNPYGYGRIHRRADIDKALKADDPFDALGYRPGPNSHGTHVLGIAAGNGAAGGPAGIAPEADLCFVHLGPGLGDLGNSIDVLEAIHFVTTVAGTRPLAINMSIGRHAGPHDGTLLLERAIDWLIVNRPGTAVVQSTGNYHARNTHMSGRLREMRTERLPFRLTRRDATPVVVELWYKAPDSLTVRAVAPDGASVSAERGETMILRGRDGTELGRLYHRAFDPNNGDHFVMLTLDPAAPAGEWALEITGTDVVDGRWHAWIERNAACPSCQGQFLPQYADPGTSTGSICNAMRTIAVGAYDGHEPSRPVAKFSSDGPTRDGRPKPLLSAPGVKVLSVRSRASASDPPGYVRMSGTSMAAPHVTGAMALMMQAAGVQPIAAMRRALFGALEPAPGPGRRWGYGLLDVPACVANAHALKQGKPLRTRAPTPQSASPGETGEATRQEAFAMTDQLESVESSWSMTEAEVEALFAPSPAAAATADPAVAPDLGMDPAQLLQADPAKLLHKAADPGFPSLNVVGYPGKRLEVPLARGDLIVDRRARRRRRVAIVDDPALQTPLPGDLPGRFVRLREGIRKRLTGPDALILPEYYVLRPSDEGIAEAVSKPTLRQGSAGAAVTEAQMRLNQIHTLRIARAEGGLDRCPLVTDGKFGQNTRAAVVSFQRIVFPGKPSEWDGVVGPRTWQALIDASSGGEEEPKLPGTCPGLAKKEVIDNFDFGSSKVLPRHQPKIVAIARCVVESQKTKTPITKLTAVGHTDPVGDDPDNVQLGLDRANAIKKEILEAIKRITGKTATLVIDVESRGEKEPVPGDDAASRRVEVLSDFEFIPVKPPVTPAAEIEFVLDDKKKRAVDAKSPVATALMFGLWDKAYDAAGDVRNGAAEADNFVGSDVRRFYIRVRDSKATGSTVTARWKTITAGGADDDGPASLDIRLTETSAGSKVFVSKGLMLVTDDTDAKQSTHSGFASGSGSGVRKRGESNHRLRRAALDGQVKASYTPAGGGAEVSIIRPVFARKPEARRKLAVRVVNYDNHATAAQIANHFAAANRRWMQTGLRIDPGKTEDRTLPAAAKDGAGRYAGEADNPAEVAALDDLINAGKAPDDTLTVVFVQTASANAYATLFERTNSTLGDRYFIFINPGLDPVGDTLGHEMHHVLHNRPDTRDGVANIAFRPFFSFNTNPSASYGLTLPDVRVRRRIHTLHSADPNNDPSNDNVVNWMRRRRTTRFPFPQGANTLDAADSSTGNTLTRSL